MDHDLIGVPSFNARGFLKIWYVRITAFATSIFMGSKLFGHTNIIVNINIFFTLGWESFDAFDGELSPWSFFCQSCTEATFSCCLWVFLPSVFCSVPEMLLSCAEIKGQTKKRVWRLENI